MQENTMSVDEDEMKMLWTYPQVVNYLPETYYTDIIIQKAYAELLSCHQSSEQTELDFTKPLFTMVYQCGNVLNITRLKAWLSYHIDEASSSEVNNQLTTNRKVDYTRLSRCTQALRRTHRACRRQISAVVKPGKDKQKQPILEADYSSPSHDMAHDVAAVQSAVHLVHTRPASTSVLYHPARPLKWQPKP